MADVGHHNAAAWLDHFELRAIDTATRPAHATLAPKPSAGHAARFATASRLERLGQHLARLSGRPVRVSLAAPRPDDRRVADAGASGPASAAPADGSPGGGDAIDRRDALGLPIVRDAFEVFPDAILVDARKDEDASEETPEPPAA